MAAAAPRLVFDAHFHIGAYGAQLIGGQTIRPIPAYLDHHGARECARHIRHHGLRGGLVVPTYLEDQTAAFRYNELVLKAVEGHEELLGGLWVSPLPEVETLCLAALAVLPRPGIRALKIASNTWQPYGIDPAGWSVRVRRNVERILDAARLHKLVIHFHTGYLPGAQPAAFDAFMKSYGKAATYQFVHMGEAIAPVFSFVPQFLQWLDAGCDIYTDTSLVPGFAPKWLLGELDRRGTGCERVLFATDAPWGSFEAEYAKIKAACNRSQYLDQICWQNAARLYGLGNGPDAG